MTAGTTTIARAPVRTTLDPNAPRGRSLCLLVTSAGRRVELLQCFRAAAVELDVDLRLLACDLHPELSSACRYADAAFAVPRVEDPGYTDMLLDICADQGVMLVVPTIDPELLPLALARSAFETVGADVAVSDHKLVEIARDKLATADFLSAHAVPSPRTITLDLGKHVPADWVWPSIVKPRHGSASRGLRLVAGPWELPGTAEEPLVLQQLVVGVEFTVNMFFDRNGRLRCAIPHERLQVRAGEVEKGRTRRIARLAEIARRLAAAMPGPRGALCFQAMLAPDGEASVFEINARFGGGYPLAHRAGATFAKWLIEERLDLASSADDDWREDVVMLRYDAALFVEP